MSIVYGAVYGDIIGSYYEVHCTKSYDFELNAQSSFTDDTVLTVAVCSAILDSPGNISRFSLEKRALEYAGQFKRYYSYCPNAGFGNMFSQWAQSGSYTRMRSYANGAAMRVVPIGWAYDSLEQVKLQAKASCLYTHRHREAIRAASAVASAVFLARNGESKQSIGDYIAREYGYDFDRRLEQIKQTHVFNSRCSYSVPPAIIAFLESSDYESAVRNAVSLGGDADTQACIAGGIAEAFYRQLPKHLSDFCGRRLDYSMKQVLSRFRESYAQELC